MKHTTLLLMCISILVTSCAPAAATPLQSTPSQSPTVSTLQPTSSFVPLPTPTATPTPPPVPGPFTHGLSLLDEKWSTGGTNGSLVKVNLQSDAEGKSQLVWDYSFQDPLKHEYNYLTHPIPADFTSYKGLYIRFFIDSPAEANIYMTIADNAGRAMYFPAFLDVPGWNELFISDIRQFGRYEKDPINFGAMDKITIVLSDYDWGKDTGGTWLFSDIRLFTEADLEAESALLEQRWAREVWDSKDLATIGRMDTIQGWTGPSVKTISVSPEGVENSLKLSLNLDQNEHLRLERNFTTRGQPEKGWEPYTEMWMGEMQTADLQGYRSISFLYKTDITPPPALVFRIWDRVGGFLEWQIPSKPDEQGWVRADLNIPDDVSVRMNIKRVGGFNFELQAKDAPARGDFWIDELKFSPEISQGIQPGMKRIFGSPVAFMTPAIPVKEPLAAPPIQIIIPAEGGVEWNIYHRQLSAAISNLQQSRDRFAGVTGAVFTINNIPDDTLSTIGEDEFREIMVAISKWCEDNDFPFYVSVIGIDGSKVPNSIVEAMALTAPNAFLGVNVGEYWPGSFDSVKLQKFIELLDILKKYNKRMFYFNWGDSWFRYQLNPGKLDRIFSPKYADTIVPVWELLEFSCANLAPNAILGLWTSGRVNQWGTNPQSWGWTHIRWGNQLVGMPDHDLMRMLLMGVAMGGSVIYVEHPLYTDKDLQALTQFSRMINAGIILPSPGWQQMQTISSAAFQTIPTSNDGWGSGMGSGIFQCSDIFPYERSQETLPGNYARYLYRTDHYYDDIFPETPYGLVPILPPGNVPDYFKTIFQTDGQRLQQDGQMLSALQAREITLPAFQQAAFSQPFEAPGTLFSAYQVGEGDYIAYLIDPEERFPIGVQTYLEIRTPGNWDVYDAVSGDLLGSGENKIEINVPAGAFRILRLFQR